LERAVYSVYVVLGLWLLVLTYARSALIIAVVITPLLLYLLSGLRLSVIGAVVVILGIGAVVLRDAALTTRSSSLLDLHNSGYTNRLLTWQWALNAFVHHPLFGVGPRNLQFVPGAPFADAFRHRLEDNGENSYINTLADLGVVGFAALMLCIVTGVRRLWSGLSDRTTWLSRSWHIGFLVGCAAVLLDSLVHPTFASTQVTALLCAFVGLAGPYPEAAEDQSMTAHLVAVVLARKAEAASVSRPAGVLASRVVFLVNAPGFGGAEQHSINLATDLHRRGVRVLVVCPPRSPLPAVLAERGVPCLVQDVGMPIGRMRGVLGTLTYFLNPLDTSRLQRCILTLASQEPSIFVCPFPREQLLATPLCRRLGVLIIWGVHAPMTYLPHRLILRPLWHRRAQEATAIFTVSEEFTWRLANAGFPADRLMILHNAIPQEAIIPEHERTPVLGRLVIISRLTKRKGIQFALQALPKILVRHPQAHLQIAGSGRYLHALQREARRLGVGDRVQFLGYQPNPPSMLSSAGVLLCPSIEDEVLPTTILEAFGAAVPVVASETGGIPQIVHDEQTGLLVPPGDPQALADAVSSLLDDPERARLLGRHGQELVRQGYTIEQVGTSFARLLQHIEAGEEFDPASVEPLSVSAEIRAIHRPRLIGNTGLFLIAKVLTALATALWTVLAARSLAPDGDARDPTDPSRTEAGDVVRAVQATVGDEDRGLVLCYTQLVG
jgi:glycosyltransferase involved in cell wall biosynthesis